MDIVHPF